MTRKLETAAPQRNFTLGTEERVRAVVGGPPAFARRLRAIEDLEESIVRAIVELCETSRGATADLEARVRAGVPGGAIERLDDLVRRHNRYYPLEANLGMHPRTGEMLDRTGRPWRPMSARTLDELVVRALDRVREPG
jgi:hypothetical protein